VNSRQSEVGVGKAETQRREKITRDGIDVLHPVDKTSRGGGGGGGVGGVGGGGGGWGGVWGGGLGGGWWQQCACKNVKVWYHSRKGYISGENTNRDLRNGRQPW